MVNKRKVTTSVYPDFNNTNNRIKNNSMPRNGTIGNIISDHIFISILILPLLLSKSNNQNNHSYYTYNNTYNSKSSSSKNKITHEEILTSLNSVGSTKVFQSEHKFFNAGKTELKGHKEFVFITEVNREAKA